MSKKYDRLSRRVGKLEKKIFDSTTWQCRPLTLADTAGDAQYWDIIDTRKDGTYTHIGSDVQTAPQAICEAIVAHAEEK